jgi:hypothetical protein
MHAALPENEPVRSVLTDRFYYLNNFRAVLGWLEDRYGDLLNVEERHFISNFSGLPASSQALLVRMAMRKPDLFRESKLHYEEIGSTRAAAQALIERRLVDDQSSISLVELFALLRKDELLRLFELPRASASVQKPALLELLRPHCAEMQLLPVWYAHCSEKIYRLRVAALCDRLRLLYFGNFHQTWSEFVLADLGIFRYENVGFSRESRAFQSREQIDVFEQLYRCRERFHQDEDPGSLLQSVPGLVTDSEWIEQRRAKLLFRIARRCEHLQQTALAEQIYAGCTHPGTTLRIALIHERALDHAQARNACLAGLQTPREASDRPRFERILTRLDRKFRGITAARRRVSIPTFDISVPRPAMEQPVEQSALEHLASVTPDGSRLYYVENTLIGSLFGLLCWDAIFAPVPGAFFHPYQHGPADLLSAGFVERRRGHFERCLTAVSEGRHRQIILQQFRDKAGLQSPFVAWRALDEDLLQTSLDCIPREHLRHWFEWILQDVGNNGAGFPDLVQFWPGDRRYRMIEVKGPGDHLQENQRRLLSYCAAHDLPVSVCRLRWA